MGKRCGAMRKQCGAMWKRCGAMWKRCTGRSKAREDIEVEQVQKFPGFREHAYRLLFPYEDCFPDMTPDLITVLPSGKVETVKKLVPERPKGLITYTYAQLADAGVAQQVVDNAESPWKGTQLSETPFVSMSCGRYRLIQTWPTNFNEKFKQDFDCQETNSDKKHFEPGAVQAFKACIETLFGAGATDKVKIQYCHKVTDNNNPCYVGSTESLKDYLQKNQEEMLEVGIKELTDEGFISTGVDGKNQPLQKTFNMEKNTQYVIYKKVGWETMGCCKPLEQFEKECEFLE